MPLLVGVEFSSLVCNQTLLCWIVMLQHTVASKNWACKTSLTDKAFEAETMQIRTRIIARDFTSADRPDLHAGTSPLEAPTATLSIAANHRQSCTSMGLVRISTPRLRVRCLPAEDQGKNDAGEIEPLKKRMYGTCDAAGMWECD